MPECQFCELFENGLPPTADLPSRHPKVACFGLAGLPVVPSIGFVWPGPVLPALPATTIAAAQPPLAAEGGRLLFLARQARQA